MLALLLSLPQVAALVLAVLLFLFAVRVLRGNSRYLAVLLILMVCRVVICAQFHLLVSGRGVLAVMLGSLADFFFLSPLLLMRPGRKREVAAMFAALAVVALNIADASYALESCFRLQYMFFENLDLTAMLIRKDYLIGGLAGGAALLGLFLLLFFKLKSAPTSRIPALGLLVLCGLALGSGFVEAPPVASVITGVQNAEPPAMLKVVADSAVRNFAQDALRPSPNRRMVERVYSQGEVNILRKDGLFGPRQAETRKTPAYDRVIWVFVESMSYEFVEGKPTQPGAAAMPFMHSLMQDPKNMAVPSYYSSAFSTNDAIYAALASRPDFGGDVLSRRGAETVFSLAAQQGYTTAFFLGSSGEFGRLARNYKSTLRVADVYDKSYDPGLPPAEKSSEWGDLDQRMLEKVLAWVKEHKDGKFVIAASTIDMHPPFYQGGEAPPNVVDTPLSRACYSTDKALQYFMEGLRAMGLPDDRTLVIISADHQITHGGRVALDSVTGGTFGSRHIPLVLISPNQEPLAGMDSRGLCSAVDMAPTLGDLLALPPQPTYYGKSLLLPGRHYEIALTRDGLLIFAAGKAFVHLPLNRIPHDQGQSALYKWYFNTQQGYPQRLP